MTPLAGSNRGYTDGPASLAQFDTTKGVSADEGGNIFVADHDNGRIRRIDWVTRVVSTVAGNAINYQDGVGTAAGFIDPIGLTMNNGSIYVVDSSSVRHIGMMHVSI